MKLQYLICLSLDVVQLGYFWLQNQQRKGSFLVSLALFFHSQTITIGGRIQNSRPGELYLYSNAYWIERCTLRNMITAIFSTGSHHDHNAEASTEVKVCFISLICAILWLCLSGNIVSNQMPLSWLAAAVFWMQ